MTTIFEAKSVLLASGLAAQLWLGTWSAAPQPQKSGLQIGRQTVREIAHVSVGGSKVRIHLSNAFGTSPVSIASAHVALRAQESEIDASTDRPLTFSGVSHIAVAPGSEVISDAVTLDIPDFSDVAVSLMIDSPIEAATWHVVGLETNYVSPTGDFTMAKEFPVQTTVDSVYFLDGIDVMGKNSTCSVVALGDSITDGIGTDDDTQSRWPDFLARRLIASGKRVGVLNEGIGFNRILEDQPDIEQPSVSVLKRFQRDVLDRSGVCNLILLAGINDIGMTPDGADPRSVVSALVAADREIIAKAHAAGISVIGATLTPIGGSGYDSPEHEKMRQALNAWIRDSKEFDSVADFDAAVRDPHDLFRLLGLYDSGDHLHPGALGYEAMSNAVDRIFAFAEDGNAGG